MAAAKKSIGQALADSTAFKVMVAAALVGAVVVVGYSAVAGKKDPSASSVMQPPQMGSANLGQAPTPAYATAIREANQSRADEARKSGDSALPTPMVSQGDNSDPLAAYRTQEHKETKAEPASVTPASTASPTAGQDRYQQLLEKLGQAMLQDIDRVEKDIRPPSGRVTFVSETRSAAAATSSTGAASVPAGAVNSTSSASAKPSEPKSYIIMAGDQAYGQARPEINSDVESPVIADVYSGPFNGGRAIGRFKSTDECVVLNFSTVTANGQDYPVEAVAVDPDTGAFCIADDVNHHYLERVVLPALGAFASGYGEAASQSRSTVVINGTSATTATDPLSPTDKLFAAGGKAAEKIGGILEEKSRNAKPTVRVFAGRPIGIWFLKSVEAK